MTTPTSQAYLRNAVMTASPEQLQLMLYDGAIRFAALGREALEARNFEAAYEKLSRAQKIILEMERGLNPNVDATLCARMSALYMFIYRKLVDGCVTHEVALVDEALKILRYERETWVMLLDKLARERAPAGVAKAEAAHSTKPSAAGEGLSVEG